MRNENYPRAEGEKSYEVFTDDIRARHGRRSNRYRVIQGEETELGHRWLESKDKAFLLLRIKKFGDRHKIAFSAQENKWNQEYHSRTRIRRFHFQERLDILPVFAVTKCFEITADVRGQMPIPTIYAEKDGSKKEVGSVSGNKEQ